MAVVKPACAANPGLVPGFLLAAKQRRRAKRLASAAGQWGPYSQMRTGVRGNNAGQSGLYLNLAPPSAASYISPPLMIEKEAMPFS